MSRCCWNDPADPLCHDQALPGEGSRYCYAHFKKLVREGLPPVTRDECGTAEGALIHRDHSERKCPACRSFVAARDARVKQGQRERASRQARERQAA